MSERAVGFFANFASDVFLTASDEWAKAAAEVQAAQRARLAAAERLAREAARAAAAAVREHGRRRRRGAGAAAEGGAADLSLVVAEDAAGARPLAALAAARHGPSLRDGGDEAAEAEAAREGDGGEGEGGGEDDAEGDGTYGDGGAGAADGDRDPGRERGREGEHVRDKDLALLQRVPIATLVAIRASSGGSPGAPPTPTTLPVPTAQSARVGLRGREERMRRFLPRTMRTG